MNGINGSKNIGPKIPKKTDPSLSTNKPFPLRRFWGKVLNLENQTSTFSLFQMEKIYTPLK